MEKTKEEFTVFMHQAMQDRKSNAFQELYELLVNVFARADVSKQGKVNADSFDTLVEEAVTMPRVHGYAPQTNVLYPTVAERKSARAAMFAAIDVDNDGSITLEEWITYAVSHIAGKEKSLPCDPLGGSVKDLTKADFIKFIKKAVDKGTPEYRQLYYFLLQCFTQADQDRDGLVNHLEFDAMVERAVESPRRFGLAPSTESMFKNNAERISVRKAEFDRMDKNKRGTIQFNEWLEYAIEHIIGKVASL